MVKKIIYGSMAILLLASQAFCAAEIVDAKLGGVNLAGASTFSYESKDDDYLVLNLKNAVIPTGNSNYVEFRLKDIYHWDHIDVTVASTNISSITTANISWEMPGEVEATSETLTLGTPITYLLSNILDIKIYNPSANAEITVTLNVRMAND